MKPLELTIYPKVDRWVDWTMEFLGKEVKGSSRECGYETPRGVFEGDEWPEKRLTDAELAAEWHKQDNHCGQKYEGYAIAHNGESLGSEEYEADKLRTTHRFATTAHYDEENA